MSTRKAAVDRGFTLVELLTVVVVIAVLAAIFFAVFARARENGRRAVCQSNLKQIALAMRQYVQDHDGRYPGMLSSSSWSWDIYPYVKSSQIFTCPTQDPNAPDRAAVTYTPGRFGIDYSYNFHRLNEFKHRSIQQPPGRSEAEVLDTTTVWLNADEDFYAFRDGKLPLSTSSCGRKFYWQIVHSGGANYSFLDGHVKWLTPQQMSEIECKNGPLPAPFENLNQ